MKFIAYLIACWGLCITKCLNPRQVWLMVALISGVSRAGYVALRFAGQRYGFALLVLDWGKLSA